MAELFGSLYLDVNANGTQELGLDRAVEGWTVFVDYNGNGLRDTGEAFAVTASDGSYRITGIQDGTYEIRILSATGDRITYNPTTGLPTNTGGWLPSDPLTTDLFLSDRYYIASFSSTGTRLGAIDFDDAALQGLRDNSALSATNQVWSDLGLKFWLDSNRDFIGDATQIINGVQGGAMYVEQRGGNETTSGFVNDFATGPFDISNRFNKRVFDTENAIRQSLSESSQAGALGTYFLRGSGLFTTTAVPTFLIQYETPTAAAKGWIWDIDTTWNEQLQGLTEKWRVEWFDSNQQLLGSQDSPAGQSVWIQTSAVNANPTLYANTTPLDTDTNGDGILDADLNPNWSYNYNSLDAKLWEWSFARQQADVSYVRVTFTGQKTLNTDVGFAFDRFDAFAVDSLTADFGVYQLAGLGDRVWLDTNANGLQEAGEDGIAGVSVQLLGSDGTSVIASAITGADGSYLFSNLTPGTYYVRVIRPDGYAAFSPEGTTNDLQDSDVDATGLTGPIELGSGESDTSVDAGLYRYAEIGDRVWLDENADGIQDAGESGIGGVTAQLIACDGTLLSTTTTDADGFYLFSNLIPEKYRVQFILPDGYAFSPANVTDDLADSDADATGRTEKFVLSGGESNLSVDAGLYQLPLAGLLAPLSASLPSPEPSAGSNSGGAQLSGSLYLDVNANGSQESGTDQALQGWTVFVDYNGDGLLDAGEASAVTASDGSYTITGIQYGTYEVRILSATGQPITYDPTTGSPTNPEGWLPSDPLTTDTFLSDRYYIASFSSTGTNLGSIDFEDAALRGLRDNSALTADNQVWSDLGLQFWLDTNHDFIGDTLQSGGTMYVEQRGGSEATSSFVNDFTTGPFDIANRSTKRVFDTENAIRQSLSESSQAGALGTYFLRGGGLFTTSTVPTFLIEYTTPTAAAKGWIWDIDTTWNEQLQGLAERWKVEWFDSNQQLLGSQESPVGQSVWIQTATVNANPTLYANTTVLDTDTNGDGILDADRYSTWSYNYNSLDGKLWEWSFDRQQADVSYVRVTFTGQKTLNTDVGFAFDRFDAFAVDSLTADFGVYQLATIGDRVWLDGNRNGIQNTGEPGVGGVTVRLLDGEGNPVLDSNGAPIETTTGFDDPGTPDVNEAGFYQFTVRPGTYSVEFDLSSVSGVTDFTAKDAVSDDGLDSDANATGRTASFTVTSGQSITNLDAGLLPSAQSLTGEIGDRVWIDTDRDGIQDAGEAGIEGVSVKLLDSDSGSVLASTTTAPDGSYLFSGLGPSTYRVQFALPGGYSSFSPADATDDLQDSDADVLGMTGPIGLGEGESNLSVDAGLLLRPDGTGEGLTPNYWETLGDRHSCYPSPYRSDSNYETVFGVNVDDTLVRSLGNHDDTLTFYEALSASENTVIETLLRQSTAGILNAAHPSIDYYYSIGEVIDYTRQAFAGTLDANTVKDLLAYRNQTGAVL